MTKREVYDVIANVFADIDNEYKEDVLNLCEKEIAALDRKNVKARERAAAKKEAGDAIKQQIAGMLSENPLTIDDILDNLDNEEMTRNKVIARMTQLIKDGIAEKGIVKIDKRKIVAYVAAGTIEEV